MATLEQIKTLRERTGAGVVDVKKALDEAGDDESKAIDILRLRGIAKAAKKSDRDASEGMIVSYVHTNGRVGVLLKLLCETDFVARNEEFQELGRDIAMHIAALNPKYARPEEVTDEEIAKERVFWMEEVSGKPEAIVEKILAGKEKKFREERALLTQMFVKDGERTVGALLAEKVQKIGENIQVGDFIRFEL
jgi:elongation factor Ts